MNKPQRKCDILITFVAKEYNYIHLYCDESFADRLSEFGKVSCVGDSSNKRIFRIDERYDFDEILKWIEAHENTIFSKSNI